MPRLGELMSAFQYACLSAVLLTTNGLSANTNSVASTADTVGHLQETLRREPEFQNLTVAEIVNPSSSSSSVSAYRWSVVGNLRTAEDRDNLRRLIRESNLHHAVEVAVSIVPALPEQERIDTPEAMLAFLNKYDLNPLSTGSTKSVFYKDIDYGSTWNLDIPRALFWRSSTKATEAVFARDLVVSVTRKDDKASASLIIQPGSDHVVRSAMSGPRPALEYEVPIHVASSIDFVIERISNSNVYHFAGSAFCLTNSVRLYLERAAGVTLEK